MRLQQLDIGGGTPRSSYRERSRTIGTALRGDGQVRATITLGEFVGANETPLTAVLRATTEKLRTGS